MKERHCKNRKCLHMIPLLLGLYGGYLGFGLIVMGLAEIREGIGIVRFVIGLGVAGFGLLGIWDGVRDLVRPEKKTEKAQVSQFILTDICGNKNSHITSELLRKQMDMLAKSEDYKSFYLQILPPFSVEERGMLKQISCVYHDNIILIAFFETPEDGYRIFKKSTEPDMAEEWLKQLLAGNPDFSQWENIEVCWNEEEIQWEETDRKGQMNHWHKFMVIFGESWYNEYKFFSARDVELAVEGIYEGKYQRVVLEWGTQVFDLFCGVQNDLRIIWCTNNTEKGNTRFLAREGNVTQVKFWLVNYLDCGFFEEMSDWTDITALIEKEKRKGEKKNGKIF